MVQKLDIGSGGNLLLNRLTGAKMVVFPARTDISRAQQVKEIQDKMKEYSVKLRYTLY